MNKIYTVALGKFSKSFTKDQRKVMKIIRGFKGLVMLDIAFVGDLKRGTLLFFKTLNDAKEARNILRSENVQTGTVIMECDYEIDEKTKEIVIGKGVRAA